LLVAIGNLQEEIECAVTQRRFVRLTDDVRNAEAADLIEAIADDAVVVRKIYDLGVERHGHLHLQKGLR
jgi:UDP-glucose 6-dehydrogenase